MFSLKDYEIEKVIVHPYFKASSSGFLFNDVALVRKEIIKGKKSCVRRS